MKDLELISVDGKPFEETQSGLVVPSDSIEREKETWIKEEVKKFDRAIEMLNKKGIEIVAICRKCNAPLKVKEVDGRISLQCQHKDRILRKDI